MKKTKKKSKSKLAIFSENPFLLAITVFISALLINSLLEMNFTKDFFNWCGYYYNSSLYWLNSTLQPTFKNHPYIHIPILTNPITAEFMAVINPWMWLRGFILGSLMTSLVITLLHIKIIKSKNIVIAGVLTGIFQLVYYAMQANAQITLPFLLLITQKYFVNILVLMVLCVIGLIIGGEYAVYLYRNEKIKFESKKDGPNIDVKFTESWK